MILRLFHFLLNKSLKHIVPATRIINNPPLTFHDFQSKAMEAIGYFAQNTEKTTSPNRRFYFFNVSENSTR